MRIRTTVLLEPLLVQKLRQEYASVSEGINRVVHEHLIVERSKSLFGAGKGLGLLKNWVEEEEAEDRAHETLYQRRRK